MTLWLALALPALVAMLALYPAELSWLSTRGTRWLYDRAATSYNKKWQHHDYQPNDALIQRAAKEVAGITPRPTVLDLGCGSGRATQVAAYSLGIAATYTAVDFSPRMLAQLALQQRGDGALANYDITLVQSDILPWLQNQGACYDLVLCMEVGEFLPQFGTVLELLGKRCNAGARLVMTRPAGYWHYFFPGRRQSRGRLKATLEAAGFVDIHFRAWRSRYELLSCRRRD